MWLPKLDLRNRTSTPTILQLEAAECGAASLGMILAYYGRFVSLEELRTACGVSRDGSKASSIVKAARSYGLEAKGLKAEIENLGDIQLPAIAFVDFCHFIVIERFTSKHAFLNDPARGKRKVALQEFDEMFTGVVLTFRPTDAFVKSDDRPKLFANLVAQTSGFRIGMLFVLLASLALVIPGLVLPILSRVFVDQILVRGLDDWILPLLIGMVATAIVRYWLTLMQSWYLAQTETRLAVRNSKELLQHILRLPVAYFGVRYAGDIASRLQLSIGLASLLTGEVARTALNIITATFFLGLMLAYSPTITLMVVLMCTLNIVAVISAGRIIAAGHRKISIDNGKLNGIALSSLRDIDTYKAAGAEDSIFARWSGLYASITTANQQISRRLIFIDSAPQFINAGISAGILVLGGLEVMRGDMTIGTLVAFQSLSSSFVGPLIALTGLTTNFQEVRSYTERIEDVVRQPVDPTFEVSQRIEGRLPQGILELKDVSFGYNPLEPPLIDSFSLQVPQGSRVALVGASGSGKSTIGRLMVGLFPVASGDVLIDGEPINSWSRPALASRLSYIDQEVILFEGTVRENITLWDPTITDANVVRAAQDAAIHDVIAARAGNYEGKVEEDGRNFSGGQRQRLEIARALASNPQLIVLDEATSALDTIAEAKIMESIRTRGITVIMIAHRLSTIRDCDEIIVLDKGKPVERGTHEELMKLDGQYARLIEM